jgi:hypothetical protein
MISSFYTRKETATRLSVFYTGNLLASAFSGLIAAGVFAGLDGKHGLEGWRWLFLIQGVITGIRQLFHYCSDCTNLFSQSSQRFSHSSCCPTRLSRPDGSPQPSGNWHTTESTEIPLRGRKKLAYGRVCAKHAPTTEPGYSRSCRISTFLPTASRTFYQPLSRR